MQRHVDRNRPADSGRDGRDRDRDRGTDRGVVVPGRPGVGAVVQAVITSVKPQLGLFVELPLPSREFEGLVHLSEISWDLQQYAKRVRGQPDEREKIGAEITKTWGAGDKPFVRILKYKMDRGKTVADVSMLDVEQRGARSQPRDTPRQASPVSRDLRTRDRPDDARAPVRDPDSDRRLTPAAAPAPATHENREVGAEGEDHRRKRSQISRSLGSRDVRLPELHSMHQAKIINAFHDGIFVSLPGYEVDGLVHHSQISRQLEMDNTLPKVERFKRIQEIVGDIDYEVWVKIVYVAKTEHLKCECSLKMVSQKNGRDLDPDQHMWIDYMRARRAKGAGFMHPEMKAEMDRVDRLLSGPDNSPIDENESASSKARLDPEALVKHEPARNDRGNDRDRKRTYDDRSAAVWTGGYNSFDAAQLSADRKNTRYDEPPYDRPSNRRNDREGPTRSPPTSRRRFEDAPSSSMHERQHVDSHSRGNYHQSGSEDRRPQEAWNRPHAEATSYPTRAAQARPAAALSGLGGRCGADILEDPAIKARFQEVVAESVRQQLEALANAPASSTRQLEAGDRSAGRQQVSHYGHRER